MRFDRRDFLRLSLLPLLPSVLASCSETQEPVEATQIVFGTVVNLQIYNTDKQTAENAIARVESYFQQFHHEWHAWEKGGILSKINTAIAEQKPIEVADSVKNFILKSRQLTRESDGLFDPGIGKIIEMWGFHSEHWQGPPPEDSKIHAWLQSHPSLLDVYFKGNRLYSTNSQVQLDFGGNAKGLAIDLALQQLQQAGIHDALVSIGGDMKAIGHPAGRQEWNIGIQDPKNSQKAIAALHLNGGESVVTSGTYQRYFIWKGQRYAHIIDPNTGYPADSFSSVTVIHPDAITADSAATALLVAGPERWQTIAAKMGIQYAFCIGHDGAIQQTKAMEQRVKLL
ncbi:MULTISPECIES: FAD:protein FMN transferase [Thiomicrorhabdus]|uniref:FAD:protein FMN transferase n=1 Tax=Thiomicrorhabdus heinhorstiae TaxID=2748010 RepID=A0ABS0BVI6_9GAMM|nr:MULTISPECIES: FAD:protein FMN transferase [Thiomicrorhabdus]MBF6057814.1 FAD:protein FMN transferase [Thiomicrorhabdus heinhorstiae]